MGPTRKNKDSQSWQHELKEGKQRNPLSHMLKSSGKYFCFRVRPVLCQSPKPRHHRQYRCVEINGHPKLTQQIEHLPVNIYRSMRDDVIANQEAV